MTTHDHPSDEAKPLEDEFATETDLPEEAVRSLDTDRAEDKDADQPGEAPAPHSAPFRNRFGLSTRAWRVIGVIGLVLSVCGVGLVGRVVPARGLPRRRLPPGFHLVSSPAGGFRLYDRLHRTWNLRPGRSRDHLRHQGRVLRVPRE